MPIIRYTCLVGSFLLGMLFLLGDRDTPAGSPVPDRWTSVDSLRAMAHLGEPVQGQAVTLASCGPKGRLPNPPAATTLQKLLFEKIR